MEQKKYYYTKVCVDWLKKLLAYGKSTLQRTGRLRGGRSRGPAGRRRSALTPALRPTRSQRRPPLREGAAPRRLRLRQERDTSDRLTVI
ncbi:unnamed protein product [Arctogadus glacialis]